MKIAVLEPLGVAKEKLRQLCETACAGRAELTYYDDRREEASELIRRSADADAVILTNLPYPAEVIAACKNLKFICVAFTGTDHLAMELCRERGITVSNCAGYSTCAVADLVFGMALSLARNLRECDKAVREGKSRAGLVGFELMGKTFGVIGTGAIGTRVAAIAAAFGCQVLAYSRTKKVLPGVSYVTLEELLSRSDIVSLHLPATAETKNLINRERLGLMKPGALLINTARGAVVDSSALADALKEGVIAGAGVDVFEGEPPIPADHPLFGAPHLLAAPHVAFATTQAMEKRAVIVADNLKAWLDGAPINLV